MKRAGGGGSRALQKLFTLENENRETRGEKSLISFSVSTDERRHHRKTEMVGRDGKSKPGENGLVRRGEAGEDCLSGG
jgi:hypothetical protein